jgi:acyl-coenzyme A thioesterase PaaI-like protein
MALIDDLQKSTEGLFPGELGVRFLSVTPDEIRAEMEVTRVMCTLPGRMHGGALMAFAAGLEGGKVIGTATPLHRGRSTMVWQTRIERDDGKLVAIVTQTQMVLPRTKSPAEELAGFFVGRETDGQMELLAILERSGAGLYRAWAESETEPERAAALGRAADREDENALLLESIVTSRRG